MLYNMSVLVKLLYNIVLACDEICNQIKSWEVIGKVNQGPVDLYVSEAREV